MDSVNVQKQARLARRHPRGQAMVEYSIINWLLLAALLLGINAKIVPVGGDIKKNIFDVFLNAIQVYQDSIYFLLNLPFP